MTPPRPALRVFWFLHRTLHRISGGRLGTSIPQGDRIGTLFLHTVGRKTGKPRTNGLFYVVDGADVVVAASNAGADTHPAWWLNLLDAPDAEVEIGGHRRPVRARAATDEEAARLWPRLDAGNPDFVAYRANATRTIPVVILEPREPGSGPPRGSRSAPAGGHRDEREDDHPLLFALAGPPSRGDRIEDELGDLQPGGRRRGR